MSTDAKLQLAVLIVVTLHALMVTEVEGRDDCTFAQLTVVALPNNTMWSYSPHDGPSCMAAWRASKGYHTLEYQVHIDAVFATVLFSVSSTPNASNGDAQSLVVAMMDDEDNGFLCRGVDAKAPSILKAYGYQPSYVPSALLSASSATASQDLIVVVATFAAINLIGQCALLLLFRLSTRYALLTKFHKKARTFF